MTSSVIYANSSDLALWTERAACVGVDTNIFFPTPLNPYRPERQADQLYDAARAICERCPVRLECLAYGLRHNERDGMWGGKTPEERDKLARQGAA